MQLVDSYMLYIVVAFSELDKWNGADKLFVSASFKGFLFCHFN